jgi:Arc/MetJ-type ribon-helix-helix transcriptional regulator
LSRKMEFEELISVLIAEHAEMKRGLAEIKQAVSKGDFPSASRVLRELDRLFRQHIADEEAQVLRLLIDAYGVKGAEDAITVFRQHRPIYDLMEEVKKLASLSPQELASSEDRLKRLLDEHTLAEETRVFPRAVSTHKERAGSTA